MRRFTEPLNPAQRRDRDEEDHVRNRKPNGGKPDTAAVAVEATSGATERRESQAAAGGTSSPLAQRKLQSGYA